MTDYSAFRRNMVENQVRANGVTDEAILGVMADIPRERFVAESMRGVAYVDEDIPLGSVGPDRYLMEPRVLGRLLQAAAVAPSDIVLDIGCGTGYSTAVLARLANTVVAVESDPALAARAGELLAGLEIGNAAVIEGALDRGYPDQAPYDVIFIGGAVPRVPAAVSDQLAEGGRLVAVVVDSVAMGQAVLMGRVGGVISSRPLFDAATPVLPGFAPEPEFEF